MTEARRGFSAANYLTDAPYTMEEPHEKVQPSTNEKTGSFDWKYYTEKTGFHPDAVELFLEPTDWRKIRQKMVIILLLL